MADPQNIVMNLVAKLDKGNIESEVAQMAQSVTQAMEQAFEALGQKIANSIMRGGITGIQGIQQAAQSMTGGTLPPMMPMPFAPPPIAMTGAPIAPPQAFQPQNAPNQLPPALIAAANNQNNALSHSTPAPAGSPTFSQYEQNLQRAADDAANEKDRQILDNLKQQERDKRQLAKNEMAEKARLASAPQDDRDFGDHVGGIAKRIAQEERDQRAQQKQQEREAANLEHFPGGYPKTSAFNQVRETLPVYREAQITNQLRDNNVNMPRSQEQQDRFKGAETVIDQSLRENANQAKELAEKVISLGRILEDNNKALTSLTGVERQTMEEKIHGTEKERTQASRDLESTQKATDALAIQKQAIQQAAQPQAAGMTLGSAAAPLGLLAAGLQFAGTLPGALRRSAAAGAEVENIEGRSLLRGDAEKAIASDRLGGMESMRSRGRTEEGLGVVGNIVGAVVSTLAAVPTGGLSLAGTAYFASKAAQGLSGFNQNVQQNVEGQLDSEQSKNFEFFQASRAGRQAAVGAFRGGQGMGAPELSGFLLGQGGDTGALRQRLAAEMGRTDAGVGGLIGNSANAPLRRQLTADEESMRQGNISQLQRQIAQAESGLTRDGRSLVEAGRERGNLSMEQVQQTLGSLAQGMGAGSFMNRTTGQMESPRLGREANNISDLLRAQGMGLTQAPQIANALQQGGMDRGQAMEVTAKLFEDAMSAGLDKAKVGQAMMTMASRAESMGFRAADVAKGEFQQSLGIAQSIFGKGVGIEGPEMAFTQRTMSGLNDLTQSKSGIGAMGGIRGVQEFAKESGMNLTPIEEVVLQRFKPDARGMQRLMQQKTGRDVSMEEAETASQRLQQLERENMLKVGERGYGGKEAAGLALAETLGTTSLSGFYANQDILGRVKSGKVGPANTGESMGIPELGIESTKKYTERDSGVFKTDGGEFNMKTGTWTPHQTAMSQLDRSVDSATGKDAANILSTVDAKNVATGLSSLGDTLPALNSALKQLIDRAQQVLSEGGGKGYAGPGAQIMTGKNVDINALLSGQNSSSMLNTSTRPISSYRNGGPNY